MRAKLADPSASTNILVQGDSTGAAPTRWVHRFAQQLAETHPALTVRYHMWQGASFLPATLLRRGKSSGSLDVWNASTPGAIISYSMVEFTRQTPMRSLDLVFINYSHNDSTVPMYGPLFDSLARMDACKFPKTAIVAVTQNPETAPRTPAQIVMQRVHARQVKAAATATGYQVVDVFSVFSASMRHARRGGYVGLDDGEHPTDAGDELWARTVEATTGL